MLGGRRLKVEPHGLESVFPFFEAFSFLLDDGIGCVVRQKTMMSSFFDVWWGLVV